MKPKRRDFFKIAGLVSISLAGTSLIPAHGIKIESEKGIPGLPEDTPVLEPLNRFPRMVHEYFVNRVKQIEQTAINRRSSLHTKKDAEEYIRDIKSKQP
jgi:hypothetical protein